MFSYLITILLTVQSMVNDPALANNPAALAFESKELVYVSAALNDIINGVSTSTTQESPPVVYTPLPVYIPQVVPQINQNLEIMSTSTPILGVAKPKEVSIQDIDKVWAYKVYQTEHSNNVLQPDGSTKSDMDGTWNLSFYLGGLNNVDSYEVTLEGATQTSKGSRPRESASITFLGIPTGKHDFTIKVIEGNRYALVDSNIVVK